MSATSPPQASPPPPPPATTADEREAITYYEEQEEGEDNVEQPFRQVERGDEIPRDPHDPVAVPLAQQQCGKAPGNVEADPDPRRQSEKFGQQFRCEAVQPRMVQEQNVLDFFWVQRA